LRKYGVSDPSGLKTPEEKRRLYVVPKGTTHKTWTFSATCSACGKRWKVVILSADFARRISLGLLFSIGRDSSPARRDQNDKPKHYFRNLFSLFGFDFLDVHTKPNRLKPVLLGLAAPALLRLDNAQAVRESKDFALPIVQAICHRKLVWR